VNHKAPLFLGAALIGLGVSMVITLWPWGLIPGLLIGLFGAALMDRSIHP
jgi:hypothetical protein